MVAVGTGTSPSRTPVRGAWRATLRMIRVRDWVHFLPLPFLTLDLAAIGGVGTLAPWLVGVVSAAGCLGFAYAWNEFQDEVGYRRETGPNGMRVPGVLLGSLLTMITLALLAASVSGVRALLAASVSLVAGALYSGGPRWKAIPIVGTVTNAAIFAPLLLLGPGAAVFTLEHALLALAFGTVLLQNQLIHEASHAAEDAADAIRTSWLTFGPRASALAAALLGAITIGMLLAVDSTWRTAAGCVPLILLTLAARPERLMSHVHAARLRTLHRYAGAVAGGVAWLAVV